MKNKLFLIMLMVLMSFVANADNKNSIKTFDKYNEYICVDGVEYVRTAMFSNGIKTSYTNYMTSYRNNGGHIVRCSNNKKG